MGGKETEKDFLKNNVLLLDIEIWSNSVCLLGFFFLI